MDKYYLNNKPLANGNFSVHKEGCPFLPGFEKRISLGIFDSCYAAINAAKKIRLKSDGCYFCIKECSHFDKTMLRERQNTLLIGISSN